jgi:flagellin-like protein
MMTGTLAEYEWEDRAVSPVIGVILMVAITVILSAVIGAFVLEIGDRQETAPSTSFDISERQVVLQSDTRADTAGLSDACGGTCELNTTQVTYRHAGGDVLSVSTVELKVNGNENVWGVAPSANALAMGDGAVSNAVELAPQPDFRRSAGTNEEMTVGSGESWNVVAYDFYDWESSGPTLPTLYRDPSEHESNEPARAGTNYVMDSSADASAGEPFSVVHPCSDCAVISIMPNSDLGFGPQQGFGPVLKVGDETAIVWTAESGGKTQILAEYTVGRPDSNADQSRN